MSKPDIEPVSREILETKYAFYRNPRLNIEEHTFEIGLALGGTVAAGAYTAGVLDFLIEALDAWEEAKTKKHNLPNHKVRLSVISGTSGGGACALIAAKALSHRFPPQPAPPPPGQESNNPLYNVWVELADGVKMLSSDDLKARDGYVQSLLNGEFIKLAAQKISTWNGCGDKTRAYVDHPLPVFLTLTNLRGVPFKQIYAASENRPTYFVQHADYICILADTRSGQAPMTQGTRLGGFMPPPDGMPVSAMPNVNDWTYDWTAAAEFAKATAAFPFGLPLVKLSRPMEHYNWRWVRATGETGVAEIVPLEPEWDLMRADPAVPICNGDLYSFHCADGGAANNLPVELARTWLCGLMGGNPPEPKTVYRTVVVVDPFTDVPDCRPDQAPSLAGLQGRLLRALVSNNRFQTADLTSFDPESKAGRFMITPTRVEVVRDGGRPVKKTFSGARALATAGFEAFIGFFAREFRDHDYQLGRLNAQKFLYDRFVLPADNAVFVEQGDAGKEFCVNPERTLRPVIPLVPRLRPDIPPPDIVTDRPFPRWPRGKLDPDTLRKPLDLRLGAILRVTAAHLQTGKTPNSKPWQFVLQKLAHWLLGPWAIDGIIGAMKKDLKDWDLL